MTSPWDPADPVLARASFHVTARTMTDATRANIRWRFSRPASFALPLLFALAATVSVAAINPAASAMALAEPFVVILLISVVTRVGLYLAAPLFMRAPSKAAYYRDEWHVELSRAGVRARTRTSETFHAWESYVAWQEGRQTVLLYHTNRQFQFMPKSVVSDEMRTVFQSLVPHLPKR